MQENYQKMQDSWLGRVKREDGSEYSDAKWVKQFLFHDSNCLDLLPDSELKPIPKEDPRLRKDYARESLKKLKQQYKYFYKHGKMPPLKFDDDMLND